MSDLDLDDILDRHQNKTYGDHVRAEWAYYEIPALVAEVRALRDRVATLEGEIDDLANGPYQPVEVVMERLRALLDVQGDTEGER